MRTRFFVIAAVLAACYGAGVAAGLPIVHVADLALPGNATRLDYQTLDPHKHLLFIAHLGDGEVTIVNTQLRRSIAVVPNITAVHGVLAVPQLNTVYATATGTGEVVAIDESTFHVKARMPGGIYPDGMAYDPWNARLFVSDEHGDTDTVIDTKTNRRIATIPLGGDVGNTQFDAASKHIFVNVQTLGKLVEIDPVTNSILKRTDLPGCTGNHGLLIDAQTRSAFIACEDNAAFLWLDMRTMRIRGTWTVGADPDVLAMDPGRHRLYVAAESGIVAIFAQGGKVQRLAQGFFASAAHTIAVDPETHLLYFPLENVSGHPVLRIAAENR